MQVGTLAGLAMLDLSGNRRAGIVPHGLGEDGDAGFQPLLSLLRLTSLRLGDCALRQVPHQVSALSGLKDLRLRGGQGLGEEAFAPLRCLTALTHLDATFCALSAVPSALRASASCLLELRLGYNPWLGGCLDLQLAAEGGESPTGLGHVAEAGGSGCPVPFAALAQFAALTSLVMDSCELGSLPRELASLTALVRLDISTNR